MIGSDGFETNYNLFAQVCSVLSDEDAQLQGSLV